MKTRKSTRNVLKTAAAIATTAIGLTLGLGAAGKLGSASRPLVGPVPVRLTMAEAVQAVQRAVFMIGTMDREGGFEQIGTGFAIRDAEDSSVVATAAHVAERINLALREGMRVVVRRPGTPVPTDFAVRGEAEIHPGYSRWRTINQRKLIGRTTGGFERISSMIPADVAVVRVEGPLGSSVDLASVDQVTTLSAGMEVVYLGFPSENIYGQKTNVPATAGFGHIQTLSGMMFTPASVDSSLVIQHDVLLTGGSSGGPLLIADESSGRLVVIGAHSAASHVFLEDARVPLAKGYAQRADLIRELADGTALAAQDARDDVWAAELRSVTVAGSGRLDALADSLAERFDILEVERRHIDLAARSGSPQTLTIRVETGAEYAIMATGQNWDDVNLRLHRGGEELSADVGPDAIPTVRWTATYSGEAHLTVEAPTTYGSSSAEVRIIRVYGRKG